MFLYSGEERPRHVVDLHVYVFDEKAPRGSEPLATVKEWHQNHGKFHLVPISGRGETEESALSDAVKACSRHLLEVNEKACAKVSEGLARDVDERLRKPNFCEFAYINHTYHADIKLSSNQIQKRLSAPPKLRPLSGRRGSEQYIAYSDKIVQFHPHISTKKLMAQDIVKKHFEFLMATVTNLTGAEADKKSISNLATEMAYPALKEIHEFGISDQDVRYRVELALSHVVAQPG
ncbi:hypothetical protein GT360_19525 [Vibrio astriarenae]|uniref:Uncharacterized protein n=1 Tax=Vibrio astriarenae TaxID=1481923 RepID=A0A7Z2T7B9_9VIBR|nr:hypothetical protein [Vibrio astriarenae]QIA65714.1 hypothetical protein GT360_19525 [Vibrio astriarenae]